MVARSVLVPENNMNLLISYVQLLDHLDPAFDEYTYGDRGHHADRLKELKNGDYVFFHTGKYGKKFLTAYYIIDRVLDTMVACENEAIRAKYKNPHIVEQLAEKYIKEGDSNAIVFGDPILSRILEVPLIFDRELADKLSLNIKFPAHRTRSETQVISSATRNFRTLTDNDVKILLKEIAIEQKRKRPHLLRSSEEVAETLEKDIEHYIANNSTLIGKGLTLSQQQKPIGDGRLDVLFEDEHSNLVVVEVKLGSIGREALRQLNTYIHDLGKINNRKIKGVIVCAGVLPAFVEELKKEKKVQILIYGWDLKMQEWGVDF
jgi:Endonuclease NucS